MPPVPDQRRRTGEVRSRVSVSSVAWVMPWWMRLLSSLRKNPDMVYVAGGLVVPGDVGSIPSTSSTMPSLQVPAGESAVNSSLPRPPIMPGTTSQYRWSWTRMAGAQASPPVRTFARGELAVTDGDVAGQFEAVQVGRMEDGDPRQVLEGRGGQAAVGADCHHAGVGVEAGDEGVAHGRPS